MIFFSIPNCILRLRAGYGRKDTLKKPQLEELKTQFWGFFPSICTVSLQWVDQKVIETKWHVIMLFIPCIPETLERKCLAISEVFRLKCTT